MEKLMVSDVPHMLRMWDYERNSAPPENVSAQERKPRLWLCPECGYSWSTTPRDRFIGRGQCPCHEANIAIKSGVNDVLTTVKGFAELLDEDNDFDLIAMQGVASRMVVNYKCKECGRKWSAHISTQVARSKEENGTRYVVGCKHKKKTMGMTVADVPHMLKMWDFEQNPERPENIPVRDRKSRFWKCPDCGHSWTAAPNTRYKGNGRCPSHKGKKENKNILNNEETDFSSHPFRTAVADVPHMIQTWDYDQNSISPENVSARDGNPRFWKCPDCGYSWKATPQTRFYSSGKCPCHELQRVIVRGTNDVMSIVKGITDYLDENNDFADIALQGTNSSMEVNFKCDECGRKWSAAIKSQVKRVGVGEYCVVGCRHGTSDNNSVKRYHKTSYSKKYPDLIQMYQENLNSIPLEDIHGNSARRKHYYWTCAQCGNTFESTLEHMIISYQSNSRGCPSCEKHNQRTKKNFASLHPELIDEYAPDNLVDPKEVSATSAEKVDWICKKCGTKWNASFALRSSGGGKCPICNRGVFLKNINSFAAVYPDYVQYWAKSNVRKAEEVFYNASDWFSFICPTCGGEYGSFIYDFLSDENHHCPYCNCTKVSPEYNSLKALYPEVARRWSSNNDTNTDQILPSLALEKLWICKTCHGEYSAPIRDVVAGKDECPYCKGAKVLPGYNSFADKHPELVEELDDVSNYLLPLAPNEVLDNSNMKFWWTCKKDKSHKYFMSPQTRLMFEKRNREPCLYCRGLRRKLSHFVAPDSDPQEQ